MRKPARPCVRNGSAAVRPSAAPRAATTTVCFSSLRLLLGRRWAAAVFVGARSGAPHARHGGVELPRVAAPARPHCGEQAHRRFDAVREGAHHHHLPVRRGGAGDLCERRGPRRPRARRRASRSRRSVERPCRRQTTSWPSRCGRPSRAATAAAGGRCHRPCPVRATRRRRRISWVKRPASNGAPLAGRPSASTSQPIISASGASEKRHAVLRPSGRG